ncbi:MAG: DJ-1 family glyoxalase III [Bacilli bacterium]
MKGLLILADGFEDTEAIMTMDILCRAGFDVKTAALTKDLHVTSTHALHVLADCYLEDVQVKQYQFLVIPGGRAIEVVLRHQSSVETITRAFYKEQKLIGAICAGPSLLIQYGLLRDLEYTCFPSFENLVKAPLYRNVGVVVTPTIITGKAMGYTQDFALAMVEALGGKPLKDKVYQSMCGQN